MKVVWSFVAINSVTEAEFIVAAISDTADAIGEIYEHFVSEYTGTNSKLSQYFTPRKMMFLILMVNTSIHCLMVERMPVHIQCHGTGWIKMAILFLVGLI